MNAESPPPARDGGRNDGLDLLRATGAALVFSTHLWHQGGMTWLGPIAEHGSMGIYIFFPLSGYLLCRPFVTGKVDLRRYALARAARIAPAYYLALTGMVLLGMMANVSLLPALTFTAHVFDIEDLMLSRFGQSWTLGVELLFYALLPALALLSGRWLIAVVVVSWWLNTQVPLTDFWRYQLPTIFWGFGAGMLAARYQHRIPARHLWPVGLTLLVVALTLNPRGPLLTTIGTSLLILWSVEARPRMAWARWPADLSYSVYLWHLGVLTGLMGLGLTGPVLALAAVLGTVVIAWLSFRYVERPILRRVARKRLPEPAAVDLGHPRLAGI